LIDPERRPVTARARRGLSILEVVIALVILSLITAMVSGVVSAQYAVERAVEHERNALEVAHRIILQHIDDESVLRGQSRRVPHGEYTYMFEIDREVLQIAPASDYEGEIDQTVVGDVEVFARGDIGFEEIVRYKLQRVTVRVFHEDGGNGLASLTRVYNPFLDPERGLERILELFGEELDQMTSP